MGASESKIYFKKGILRLSNERSIPADDRYWRIFWSLPETAEDVFTLFSATDIRRARDFSITNIETLIEALTSKLSRLKNHKAFPHPETAPEREALNCIRVLTRLLPFIFEADLDAWEESTLWGSKIKTTETTRPEVLFDEHRRTEPNEEAGEIHHHLEETKPLAEELIDALVDLLFFSGFTVPPSQTGKEKVTYAIWQTGIGCTTAIGTSKEYESNRAEVLRLLLTLTSKSMYMPSNTLPSKGVSAITYMVMCKDKQIVLSVLCSLINVVMNYVPAGWKVPYDHVIFKGPRQTLVTYSMQMLLVLLLYPLPENFPSSSRNNYRLYFGRLRREQDFQFLKDGILRVLNQPVNCAKFGTLLLNADFEQMQNKDSYLPSVRRITKTAPENIMLFWEALQCHKRFRAYIIQTERSLEFLVPILYYALEYRNDPAKIGIVRMCIFVIQTMSAEGQFSKSINKPFADHDSLPQATKIDGFIGSYADYLIECIYILFSGSKGQLNSVYPALLAILNNIAAHLEDISVSASTRILQLFSSMSSPSFLLANETNHDLLRAILEFISTVIEHQYSSKYIAGSVWTETDWADNPDFVYMIMKTQKKFESLRMFTLESGQEEIEKQKRLQKDQLGAFVSRGNSMESMRSPFSNTARTPTLSDVPENSDAFAIGDDEDSDDDEGNQQTPSQASPSPRASRTPSMDSSAEDVVPLQLRGMSKKARGKMPVGTPNFSRQSSTTSLSSHRAPVNPAVGFAPTVEWIESWLPLLPLHTILMLRSSLAPRLRPSITQEAVREVIKDHPLDGVEPSRVRVHLFEWSTLSLGWYESLLWGLIFATEMDMSTQGTVGIWNGTGIRLFRVQEVVREGPSLFQPRGMVDAVGSNLVNRVTSLNIRGPGLEG
ncbi:MAG: hypothetical protein M1814_001659 [Vezdaea aestivalis]|nr:MAG: hypothetical protein M1814_001659 [Vezdaea aestivalis]